MAFEIEITGPALSDAEDYVSFIRDVKQEPHAAERWFRGVVQEIYALEHFPERYAVIPEAREFDLELRHHIYHSHRIVFSIDTEASRVIVYRIYHGAKKRLLEADLR